MHEVARPSGIEELALHAAFKRHAIPFLPKGLDSSDDFADLAGVGEVLGRRRLILLGEHSHGDGVGFAIKSRLTRFLHCRHGFDVVAFEAGIFDAASAMRAREAAGDDAVQARAAIRDALPAIWLRCAQVAPLVDEMAMRSGSGSLELVGFDCQFGNRSVKNLARDLGDVLVGAGVCTANTWAEHAPTLQLLAEQGAPPAPWPTEDRRARLIDLLAKCERHLGERSSGEESRFWCRVLGSTLAQALNAWAPDQSTPGRAWIAPYARRREIEMAKNLCWWAIEQYPDRKFVVWAHQGHLLRNFTAVPGWAGWNTGVPSAGEALWNALPGQVYAVGFAACGGRFGRVGRPSNPVPAPAEDSVEGAMLASGCGAALVDFTTVPDDEVALHRCECRLKGYRREAIEPRRHLDGLIVVREMGPAVEVSDGGQCMIADQV